MKVSELVDILKDMNQNSIVVMSSDSEGNEFTPLSEVWTGLYVADSSWSGQLYIGTELTEELIEEGCDAEDLYDGDDGVEAVVLWPSN